MTPAHAEIPEEVRTVYDHVRKQVLWLRRRRAICRGLFEGDTDGKRGQLQEVGGEYFPLVIEQDIKNEMVLAIGRLVEEEKESNLSLLTLARLVKERSSGPCLVTLRVVVGLRKRRQDLYGVYSRELKDLRNKRIGHLDVEYASGAKETPWTPTTWKDLDDCVGRARAFVAAVDTFYGL